MRSHAVTRLIHYYVLFFFLFLQKRIGGLYRMQLYNNGYQEVTRDRNDIRFRMCGTMLVQRFDRSVGRSVNAL